MTLYISILLILFPMQLYFPWPKVNIAFFI